MSLTRTLIIAAVVTKTLLVMNLIDRVSSESEVEKCTRYIKQLYNENDRLEIFKKGFLFLNRTKIETFNKNLEYLVPSTDTSDSINIIQTMNKYTRDYFYAVLNKVTIEGKESLPSPGKFCEDKFHEMDETIKKCTDTIIEKLNLRREASGSENFDFLYYFWIKDYIHIFILFNKEHGISHFNTFQHLFEYIESYYQLFVDILDNADVSRIPTPEQFCQAKVSESTSVIEYLEALNI